VIYTLREESFLSDRLGSAEMASRTLAANLVRLIGTTSQQEIADKVGMSRTALNKILQGRVDPRLSTVQALADVLGKPIGELTGEASETAALSQDALLIARLYDRLDWQDKPTALKFLQTLVGERSSSQ
jgi:transcriptional regulator with XRE-family HTH domain